MVTCIRESVYAAINHQATDKSARVEGLFHNAVFALLEVTEELDELGRELERPPSWMAWAGT